MCVMCAGPARYFSPFVGGAACPVVLGDSKREGAWQGLMARGRVTESSGLSPREPHLIAQGQLAGEVLPLVAGVLRKSDLSKAPRGCG